MKKNKLRLFHSGKQECVSIPNVRSAVTPRQFSLFIFILSQYLSSDTVHIGKDKLHCLVG